MKTKLQEIKEVLRNKKTATVVEIANYNTGAKTEYKVIKVLKGGFLITEDNEMINPYLPDVVDIY